MPPPAAVADAAQAYSDTREQITAVALGQTRIAARALAGGDPEQWRNAVADVGEDLLGAQYAAVQTAEMYVEDVLAVQQLDTAADARVVAESFVDQTDGGGSWLANLVYAPPSAYDATILAGEVSSVAAARAGFVANAIVLDGMRDMYRAADVTAAFTRPSVYGYVRALRGVSCARCAVLAGRHYRTGRSFRRHPRCDCYMIPTAEDRANAWETSPRGYFNRLTPEQRVDVFGQGGARAIAAGADISQVVNAYDGVQVVQSFGRTIRTTSSGTSVRGLYGGYEVDADGVLRKRARAETERRKSGQNSLRYATAPRLLPDEIFAQAEIEGWSREQTLTALARFAYITT